MAETIEAPPNGWEYNIVYAYIEPGGITDKYPDPSLIWTKTDAEGHTVWQTVKEWGEAGFDIASVVPIQQNGKTVYIMFVVKRPKK